MHFEIIGSIKNIETIAVGRRIREIQRLHEQYGIGRWRKLKGIAYINLANGNIEKQRFIGMKLMVSAEKR